MVNIPHELRCSVSPILIFPAFSAPLSLPLQIHLLATRLTDSSPTLFLLAAWHAVFSWGVESKHLVILDGHQQQAKYEPTKSSLVRTASPMGISYELQVRS